MNLLGTVNQVFNFLNDFISEIEDNALETVFFSVIVLYNTFSHNKNFLS